MNTVTHLFSLALLLAAACAPGQANDTTSEGEAQGELQRYALANLEHPEVGELIVDRPDDPTTVSVCTATLIGSRTILTAGHCFEFGSTISTDPIAKFRIQPADGSAAQDILIHRARVEAGVLEFDFDLAIAQLDHAVPPTLARPDAVAPEAPRDSDSMTVYGYGKFGSDCSGKIDGQKRKWTSGATGLHKPESCPGDSGGAYFDDRTGEIIATVKGPFIWEIYANPVKYRRWILDNLEDSENGALSSD